MAHIEPKNQPVGAARPRFWRVSGVAKQLGVSDRKAWQFVEAGRLRTQKLDGCTVVADSELDRFIAEEVRDVG